MTKFMGSSPLKSLLLNTCMALSIGAGGVVSQNADAAPILFSDVDDFKSGMADAGVRNVVFQDFESEPLFGERSSGGVSEWSFDDVRLLASGESIKMLGRSYSGNHNITPGGHRYLSFDTDQRWKGDVVDFVFSRPVLALGFTLVDHDADDALLSWGGGHYTFHEVSDGGEQFLGITFDESSALTRLSLDTGRDSQVAIDDFYVAYVPVSEPSHLFLLNGATLGLMLARRRRLS